MSGYVSPFPSTNDLYNVQAAEATRLQNQLNYQRNPLLLQEDQQKIGSNEMEMMARASQALLDPTRYPDEASRAAAYPQVLADLQRYGYGMKAPSVYPGLPALQRVALMGTPSEKLSEYAANRAFNPTPTAPVTGAATGGGGAPATYTPTGTIEPDALTRATAVRDGLIKRGLDPDTATAFAANALHESSANPNTGAGDAGASHGLFQWRDDRATAYQKTFGHAPDNAPLDEQLDNVVRELSTTEGAARDRIAAAQGPAAKAAAVSQYYLRPKDVVPEMQRRGGTALQLVTQLGGSGQAAGGGQVILGDSYASPQGLGGQGVVGAQPGAVLGQIQQQARSGGLRGKDVVISTGAVNAGGDTSRVAEQIQAAKDAGAKSVTVVGAVDTPQFTQTNQQLQQIAQASGARFVPAGPAGQDGVHPASYAPLRQAVRLGGTAAAGPAAGAPAGSTGAAVATPAGGAADLTGPRPLPPVGPGSPTPPTPTQLANTPMPQAPMNGLTPPPAPVPAATAQPAAQPPQPSQQSPIVGPQPPALPPLNANQLTDQQQRLVDAGRQTGRLSPADQIKMVEGFRTQNIGLQQKAYSDYIQAQQLAVAQGHLTIDQAETNLKYWQAAHPELAPGARADTLAQRAVEELGPKVRDGTATAEEQDRYYAAVPIYLHPQIRDSKITGETLRIPERQLPAGFPMPPGMTGGSQVVVPGYSPAQQDIERDPAQAKVADTRYERDAKNIGDITTEVRQAQNDNLRVKEMQDILKRISTGPGTQTRAEVAAWFQRWAPSFLSSWERESANLDGAAAAEAFQKLAFKGSISQEQGSSPRGGYAVTKLFQQLNPGLDLLNPANKNLLDMQLIANQANIDYNQGATDHFNTQEDRYQNTHKYDSLNVFEKKWNDQRNPQVYAAAMGAVAGQPAEQWAKDLRDDEYARALQIVSRADPSAVVNTKSGRYSMQPKVTQGGAAPAPGDKVLKFDASGNPIR
jgi:hypothetical protein